MRTRRYPQQARLAGDLTPNVVAILLGGWGSLQVVGDPDPFKAFELTDDDWRALWLRHRAWLLAEWARRGGTGQPWAAKFDQKP